jgi:Domain of unknown function (DUF4129)
VKGRQRGRRWLDETALEESGTPLSTFLKAAAIVGAVIGVLLLLALPFLAPNAETGPSHARAGGTVQLGKPSPSASTRHTTSTAVPWFVVGSAAALLVLASAAVLVRSRRARHERRAVVPDAAVRTGYDLRRSLADLESERDPRLAVQRAYARMEESLGEVELSRAPDETPTEFTARVLRVLGASAAAASDLTGLFEIARFSDHPMDEDDRRRAIASVRRVEAQVAPP